MVLCWCPDQIGTRIGRQYPFAFERRDSFVSSIGYHTEFVQSSDIQILRRFDALLVTYQQLAETCLFTLRLEARCRVMYYLDMATREVCNNLK